jgi:hypothetical protein
MIFYKKIIEDALASKTIFLKERSKINDKTLRVLKQFF